MVASLSPEWKPSFYLSMVVSLSPEWKQAFNLESGRKHVFYLKVEASLLPELGRQPFT
jgi:hypothetical protein